MLIEEEKKTSLQFDMQNSAIANKGMSWHLVIYSHYFKAVLPQAINSDRAGLEFLFLDYLGAQPLAKLNSCALVSSFSQS